MTTVSLTRFASCSTCRCTKPRTLQFFHKNHKRGRWNSVCKVCASLYGREYRRKNKADLKRKQTEYRESNRELVLEQKRQSYYRNRETILAKQAQDIERRRKYLKENAEANAKHSRDYAKRYPERVKESLRRWRERNPERDRVDKQRRRARKLAAEHVRYTTADIMDMWHDQRGCCYYCGIPVFGMYHVDHREPLSRGGADRLDNLCIACPFCNVSKKDKTEQEFKEYRAGT